MIYIADNVIFDVREIAERFVRRVGLRGADAGNAATGVELRLNLGASALPQDVKARLMALGGRRVTKDGVLIVARRANRSQSENRTAAHDRLFTLLEQAARRPKTRKPTRPALAVRRKRVLDKERRSQVKQSRRRAGVLA